MSAAYFIFLLLSLASMAAIDYRHKVAFFYDAKRSAIVTLTATAVFLLWDIAGISLGIFKQGSSPFAFDFQLLPELPIEEVFFLFFLCYLSLLSYLLFSRWRQS